MRLAAGRAVLLAVAVLIASGVGSAAQTITLGEKAKLDGIISGRAGASMTLRMEDGPAPSCCSPRTPTSPRPRAASG